MTNKTIQIWLLIIAAVTLLSGGIGVIAVVARYTGSIETKVEQTGRDIAEIKVTLDKIAPPTVRAARAPEATTSKPAEQGTEAAEPGQGALPASAESSAVEWHGAYLADHCRLCPTCCATGEP